MNHTRHNRTLVMLVSMALCPMVGQEQTKATPLTEANIIDLLRNYVAHLRVGELARKRGIDFTVGPNDERQLRQAGADATLIETLKELEPKPNPIIDNFTAEPVTIDKGQSTTLRWVVSNATSITLEPGIGQVSIADSLVVFPTRSRPYTLTALGSGGVTTRTLWVTVNEPVSEPVIQSFTAEPQRIEPGQQVNLRWSVANGDEVTIEPGIGRVEPSGLLLLYPKTSITYSLSVKGGAVSRSRQATVEIMPVDFNAITARGKDRYINKDYATAATLFREAAEGGNVEAMKFLGILLQVGLGVNADAAEARNWFYKAANAGDRAAMCNLGLIYERGVGVTADREAAVLWYRQAAQAGNIDAQEALKRLGAEQNASNAEPAVSTRGVCQGLVLDSAGKPMPAVTVWIDQLKDKTGNASKKEKTSYHVKTDSTGHYYQSGLDSGVYSVHAFTTYKGKGASTCLVQ
jgi:hypothetical protein